MDAFFYNIQTQKVLRYDGSTRKVTDPDEHIQLYLLGVPLRGNNDWELVIPPRNSCPRTAGGWHPVVSCFFDVGRPLSPTKIYDHERLIGSAVDPHGHLWEFYKSGQINAGCQVFADYDHAIRYYTDPEYDGTYDYDPTIPVKFMKIQLRALGVIVE